MILLRPFPPRFRGLAGAAVLVSLALCVAAAALWARSVTTMDQLRSATPLRQTTWISVDGALSVQTVTATIPDFEPGISFGQGLPSQYHPSLAWKFAGFGAGHESWPTLDGPIETNTLTMPLWPIVVILAIPPVLLWDRRRATARAGEPGPGVNLLAGVAQS
jgi:hypothetical protein